PCRPSTPSTPDRRHACARSSRAQQGRDVVETKEVPLRPSHRELAEQIGLVRVTAQLEDVLERRGIRADHEVSGTGLLRHGGYPGTVGLDGDVVVAVTVVG